MYKKTGTDVVIRLEDYALISQNSGGEDFSIYLKWLSEGNEPLPADAIDVAPVSCTSWQIRKALNALGLRQLVEDAVAASSDIDIKDGWAHASEFRSDDEFVLNIGADIGKNADETRAVIEYASTL